jgi:hypothetical protein
LLKGEFDMDLDEKLLARKLEDAEPTLDVLGADRKILKIAFQDLTNYLRFFANRSNNNLTSANIRELSKNEKEETDSFLAFWVNMWIKKWKERFKLQIGESDQKKLGASEGATQSNSRLLKTELRQEIVDMAISALVQNSEICGTVILAENIVKNELQKNGSDDESSDMEFALTILNKVLREVREVCQRTGPLVAIKINENYYTEASLKKSVYPSKHIKI